MPVSVDQLSVPDPTITFARVFRSLPDNAGGIVYVAAPVRVACRSNRRSVFMSAIHPFHLKPPPNKKVIRDLGSDVAGSTFRSRLAPARGILVGAIIGLAAWAVIVGFGIFLWQW